MKTMTCKEMGGMCDYSMSAQTSNEMMTAGMEHLKEAHPDMAKDIEAMPSDHPMMVAWNEKFMKDWAATPENS